MDYIEKENKHIYYDGFKYHFYTCQKCGSHKVLQIASGGFSPPHLHCDECGCKDVTNSPTSLTEEEEEKITGKRKVYVSTTRYYSVQESVIVEVDANLDEQELNEKAKELAYDVSRQRSNVRNANLDDITTEIL